MMIIMTITATGPKANVRSIVAIELPGAVTERTTVSEDNLENNSMNSGTIF